MFEEALQSRLQVIEEEITRITKLAAKSPEPDQQDNYFRLAQDLQREARELRTEIIKRQSHPCRDGRLGHPLDRISLIL